MTAQGVTALNREEIKEKFFMRVVEHWNWFPKEAVDAPSLEVRLDAAVGSPV